jgi:hypothetical protein
LLQLQQPDFYVSGIPHKLFVGFQPILVCSTINPDPTLIITQILHAFLSRRPTFLSATPWKRMPFRRIPATPLGSLMNEASVIPSILKKVDDAAALPTNEATIVALSAMIEFVQVLDSLGEWYQRITVGSDEPLWWPSSSLDGEPCLWFTSISAANCMTHFWAFWVICATQVRKLRAAYPLLRSSEVFLGGHVPESPHVSKSIAEHAMNILLSMGYLMQDEFRLFGIISAALPLRTACNLDQPDAQLCGVISQSRKVISKIIQRGYQDVLLLSFAYPQLG